MMAVALSTDGYVVIGIATSTTPEAPEPVPVPSSVLDDAPSVIDHVVAAIQMLPRQYRASDGYEP